MTNGERMSDFLDEAKGILSKIEAYQGVHEEQLKMYKEMMDLSISTNKERIEHADRRISGMRSLLIGIAGLLLLSFVSDKISLREKVSQEQLQQELDEYVTVDKVLRGFGVVVDDYYEMHETPEGLTKEEAKTKSSEVKQEIKAEVFPKSVSRSAKISK